MIFFIFYFLEFFIFRKELLGAGLISRLTSDCWARNWKILRKDNLTSMYFNHIPRELIDCIFLNLSVRQILIASQVCKSFLEKIAEEHFWKMVYKMKIGDSKTNNKKLLKTSMKARTIAQEKEILKLIKQSNENTVAIENMLIRATSMGIFIFLFFSYLSLFIFW